MYKEQVDEIIQEAFETYQKDKELYQLCLKTYQQVMPHLVMSPSDLAKRKPTLDLLLNPIHMEVKNKDESGKMEVDRVVTPEP